MSPALEIKPIKRQRQGDNCAGGCKSQGRFPKSGSRQIYIMGRDAGKWCAACAKRWRELCDEATLRLASLETPARGTGKGVGADSDPPAAVGKSRGVGDGALQEAA